jgi:hypothetical protein
VLVSRRARRGSLDPGRYIDGNDEFLVSPVRDTGGNVRFTQGRGRGSDGNGRGSVSNGEDRDSSGRFSNANER